MTKRTIGQIVALAYVLHGAASWDDPIMDPMSGGFPMITFSVPVAREVAA